MPILVEPYFSATGTYVPSPLGPGETWIEPGDGTEHVIGLLGPDVLPEIGTLISVSGSSKLWIVLEATRCP